MDCETNDCRKEKLGCKGCYYEDKNIDKDIIEKLDGFFNKGWCCDLNEIYSIVMNIIDTNNRQQKELEEKDKMIDYLVAIIEKNKDICDKLPTDECSLECKECIKEIVRKKVEEDGR